MLNFNIAILNVSIMRRITLLSVLLIFMACNNQSKDNKVTNKIKQENSEKEDTKFGRNNYAIVWKWTTTDKQLVDDNTPLISNELTQLWKDGIVETAYYDSDAEIDKFENYPNISFFLKTKSYESAELILNNLTIVKKGIAVYSIYPVGLKWLGRNDKIIKEKGIVTKSYVAVWTTNKNAKPNDNVVKDQSDTILRLWNEAKIENVYFDIEGTQKANNKTDFVFFVNANTEEEAKKICDKLPFVKEKRASYELHSVGVFWLK